MYMRVFTHNIFVLTCWKKCDLFLLLSTAAGLTLHFSNGSVGELELVQLADNQIVHSCCCLESGLRQPYPQKRPNFQVCTSQIVDVFLWNAIFCSNSSQMNALGHIEGAVRRFGLFIGM